MKKKAHRQKTLPAEVLEKLYRLMSSQMTRFDCGKLCSPDHGGVPACCNHSKFHPVLFKEEMKWLNETRSAGWKKFKPGSKSERKAAAEICSYLVFANCCGAENCDRSKRALVCRFFPFEPHIDADGRIIGLAFVTDDESKCPLVSMPGRAFNRTYIRNCIKAWQIIVDLIPEERNLYIMESEKREKAAWKKDRKLRIFK